MPAGNLLPWLSVQPPVHHGFDEGVACRFKEFVLILGSLFLLDIITTEIIILMGGIELNPLMTSVVTKPSVHLALKAVVLFTIVTVSHVAEKQVRGTGVFFYCTLIAMYIFVIVNNLFVILPRFLP